MARPRSGGIQFFGDLQASVIGGETFAAHDSSRTWDDSGAGKALIQDKLDWLAEQISDAMTRVEQEVQADIKRYGADQARDAVYDYVANGRFSMAMIEGDPVVVFDASNVEAEFRVYVSLQDLIAQVVEDSARGGVDGDQIVRALVAQAERLVGEARRAPEPQRPQPRQGLAGRRVVTSRELRGA